MDREKVLQKILRSFLADLRESAKPFAQEECIEYLGILIEFLKGVFNSDPYSFGLEEGDKPFDEDEFIEKFLLKPYRSKVAAFMNTQLKLYFAKDEYNQGLLFKKLELNAPLFSSEEYQEYAIRLYTILTKLKEKLYLKPIQNATEGSLEIKGVIESQKELEKEGFKFRNPEYTRSRQIMLYFFVLQLMGSTRAEADVLNLAEFGHALFYWPVETVKNNDLYIKLRKAPLVHDSKNQNLKDLEWVKRQFEKIDHLPGIALVQKQIDSLIGKYPCIPLKTRVSA